MAGVEPARSTFVASSPKSLGPWPVSGCSPGCRAQPSPLIWQLSRAYKARPHAGADYKKMDVAGGAITHTPHLMDARPAPWFLPPEVERKHAVHLMRPRAAARAV